MSVPNKKGKQIRTLTLEQNGEMLTGSINSEGGDLPVTGALLQKSQASLLIHTGLQPGDIG